MILSFRSVPISYNGEECGYYRIKPGTTHLDYDKFDVAGLSHRLSNWRRGIATRTISELREMVREQVDSTSTPRLPNTTIPSCSSVTPIGNVRDKIRNLEWVLEDMLIILLNEEEQ